VHFLERELMPRLGDWARLVIAGQCGGSPKGRDGGPVQRLGYVKDLKAVYAAADIAVNQVAYGSGSSVKVAEYLGAGLPIVTTPVGMRGYENLGARLCAVPLVGFAAAVERLRSSAPDGLPPAREPTWTELGRRLHEAYTRILADGTSSGAARATVEAG
jgi:glycosyltransferase involved in cell wall biosynthesis